MINISEIDDLISKHPAAILLWLREWSEQGHTIHSVPKIHWRGLAEVAAGNVSGLYGKLSVLESLLWGSVSIKLREELAQGEPDGKTLLYDAMVVRFNLILIAGNHPGDEICDAQIIIDWFLREVPIDLVEAEQQTLRWTGNPEGRTFEFKLIVEQLRMLQDLVRETELEPSAGLQRWLNLLSKLET